MATSASSSNTEAPSGVIHSAQLISPSLKFVISNLKFLVSNSLTPDNYPLWSNQIVKILRANGFATFLEHKPGSDSTTETSSTTSKDLNQDPSPWSVIDQNLAAALCSTISPTVLPYLKNELHIVSMKNLSMSQYLTEIKKIVDQIASAGSTVDSEDVIIYILNGLPPSYQPFTASIRTMQTSHSGQSLRTSYQ
ncbi:uncharacterized protein LOC114579441 [Dendrobium catenatum]|uniref:uncharacterized protein LOC114579441 n=1 Tax=Dendrobium catenatum TaxID=906689 RepID=UPI0010A06735|nr:uncharacterized protein LOC114579441 [Dendrobium catenatum]